VAKYGAPNINPHGRPEAASKRPHARPPGGKEPEADSVHPGRLEIRVAHPDGFVIDILAVTVRQIQQCGGAGPGFIDLGATQFTIRFAK
jgi:hypothetical protein